MRILIFGQKNFQILCPFLENSTTHTTNITIVHYEYHLLIFKFTFALQFRAVKSNLHKSFGIWMHPWRIRIAKGRGNRMIKGQRDHHRNPQDLVGFVSASYFRGHSQTSLTSFFFFFDHILPYVDIIYLINVNKKSTFLPTHPPFHVNVVCERPSGSAQYSLTFFIIP